MIVGESTADETRPKRALRALAVAERRLARAVIAADHRPPPRRRCPGAKPKNPRRLQGLCAFARSARAPEAAPSGQGFAGIHAGERRPHAGRLQPPKQGGETTLKPAPELQNPAHQYKRPAQRPNRPRISPPIIHGAPELRGRVGTVAPRPEGTDRPRDQPSQREPGVALVPAPGACERREDKLGNHRSSRRQPVGALSWASRRRSRRLIRRRRAFVGRCSLALVLPGSERGE